MSHENTYMNMTYIHARTTVTIAISHASSRASYHLNLNDEINKVTSYHMHADLFKILLVEFMKQKVSFTFVF